jgi:hypothetical protein
VAPNPIADIVTAVAADGDHRPSRRPRNRRIGCRLRPQERADMTLYDSTDISFTNMKFGEPLESGRAANIATNATLPLIRCGTGFRSQRERP